jgi:DNA-binding XRE family transcriptional regulator
MANLPIDFCRKTAAARRARGMTQSALARSVGCAQSAISMFESGHPEKLSLDFVSKIAELLEIPLDEPMQPSLPQKRNNTANQDCYCPNPHCFSNIPYVVNGELLLWPTLRSCTGDAAVYCKICGEVLERACPGCGASIDGGAFCGICGEARITSSLTSEVSAAHYAEKQLKAITQWRDLIRNNHPEQADI